jgi:DNA-binding MarR family transcriptional regulator
MKELESNPLKKTLYTLIKLSKADIDRRFAQAKIGITPLQYGVLSVIRDKPVTLNDIARQFNFKAPSLLPSVDILQKKGFLERKNDSADRRKTPLAITQKGKELLNSFSIDDKDDALNTAYRKLSKIKQIQLLNLLKELTANFSKKLQ